MFWGLSAALDLLEKYLNMLKTVSHHVEKDNQTKSHHHSFTWSNGISISTRNRHSLYIAFTYREYEYSKPNKTAAGPVHYAGNYIHRGYVEDMQTGPFSACGLTSTDDRLLHSTHEQNDYRPTDVTEGNLLE
uniref:Dynein assembly factor 3 C-terminal domain-containing protein n=1 Tax=Glossina pallidipes TaxID=7398 RepID=A0A1A9ZNR3_GLOPL